jgi:hypothetical protein
MTDSLLAKFQDLASQKETYGSKKSVCKLTEVMQSLPPETAEYLQAILDAEPGDPRRLSNATISNVLRSEGHNVGRTTISEHRREYCQCYIGGTDQ